VSKYYYDLARLLDGFIDQKYYVHTRKNPIPTFERTTNGNGFV